MKRSLLFAFVMLFATTLMAQNRSMLIQESFDNEAFPEEWYFAGDGVENWSIVTSANAGGTANELKLSWKPEFSGIARFVSPAVDLTGISSVRMLFKHCLERYPGTNRIGVATSIDDGATWHEAWAQDFTDDGQYVFDGDIVTSDMGHNAVRFCIFYQGNTYYLYNWYFDDIEIFTMENLDLGIKGPTFPSFVDAGNVEMGMRLFNYGVTAVNSVEASYQVDGQEAVVETFNVGINSMEDGTITFATPASLAPGTHNIALTINKVNGVADDDASNNTLSQTLSVALGSVQRIPMIEHFSSSTCTPCVQVNQAMATLTANNPGKYTYTKYPMSWPAYGDPYYTEEGGVRKLYYGCSAVPQLILDGENIGYTSVSQQNLDHHYETPAFADIRGTFTVNGTTISVTTDIMSYVNMDNARVYVAVNEKTTTGNVGDNGETEFHHIMMKMLPDAEGTRISINAGEYQRLEFSFDLSTTHVEEMDDLEVAVWLQEYVSKEIFNSHFMYENAEHPYPAENLALDNAAEDESILILRWEAPAQGHPTGYNVFVNGVLVAENTNAMSYSFASEEGAFYVAEVQALYADDMTSIRAVATKQNTWSVGENADNGCRLYPNPASTMLRIETESPMQQVEVFDLLGRLVLRENPNANSACIDLSHCENGVYFVQILHENGAQQVQKVVKL